MGSTHPHPATKNAYWKAQQVESPVTSYGAKSASEDFAEACQMYADDTKGATALTPKQSLKNYHPKKFDALEELFLSPEELAAKKAADAAKKEAAKQAALKAAQAAAEKEAAEKAAELVKKALEKELAEKAAKEAAEKTKEVQWKVTMSSDEAAEWQKGSKLSDDFYHGTNDPYEVQTKGFKVLADDANDHPGISFSADKDYASGYGDTTLKIKLKVDDPLEVDNAFWNGTSTDPKHKAVYELMDDPKNASIADLSEAIEDAGHDAWFVRADDGVISEIRVFSEKKVVVIDDVAEKVTKEVVKKVEALKGGADEVVEVVKKGKTASVPELDFDEAKAIASKKKLAEFNYDMLGEGMNDLEDFLMTDTDEMISGIDWMGKGKVVKLNIKNPSKLTSVTHLDEELVGKLISKGNTQGPQIVVESEVKKKVPHVYQKDGEFYIYENSEDVVAKVLADDDFMEVLLVKAPGEPANDLVQASKLSLDDLKKDDKANLFAKKHTSTAINDDLATMLNEMDEDWIDELEEAADAEIKKHATMAKKFKVKVGEDVAEEVVEEVVKKEVKKQVVEEVTDKVDWRKLIADVGDKKLSQSKLFQEFGKEGMHWQDAAAILDKAGFKFNPGTLKTQMGKGKKLAAGAVKKTVKKTIVDEVKMPEMVNLKFKQNLSGSTRPELMEDITDGKKWVVKSTRKGIDPDHLKSEALADELYRTMGIKAPKSGIIQTAEGPAKVSEFLEDGKTLADWMTTATKAEQEVMFAQIREGFVADSLLANWDVAGLSMDNIFVVGKKAYRIDNGGALAYRAQGAKKPLGPVVDELVSLRDPKINQNTAKIFGKITDEEIDDQIYAIVQRRQAIEEAITDTQLRNTIKARIDSLEAIADARSGTRMSGNWQARVKQSKPEAGIGKDTAKRVKESRVNGTTIKTDKDLIEDNNVLVWEEAGPSGEITKVQFKVTYEGGQKLEQTVTGLGVDVSTAASETDEAWSKVLKFSKTVSTHVDDQAFNSATVAEAEKLLTDLNHQVKYVLSGEDKTMAKHYIAELKKVQKAKAAKEKSPMVTKYVRKPKKSAGGSAIKHRTEDAEFRITEIKNGRAKDLQARQSVGSTRKQVVLEMEDGTEVRYIPRDNTTSQGPALAVRGNVEITAQGEVTTERLNKIMSQIKSLGIDTSTTTAEWEELLYLHRTVYLRNQAEEAAYKTIWNSTTLTEKEKVTKIKAWAKTQDWGKKVNFESKAYKAGIDGRTMTSGNGNRYWNRWDLTPDDVESKMSNFTLSHNSSGDTESVLRALLQSGGEATSTTGRIRKGVRVGGQGMSSDTDMNTGGASYFFTRIIKRNQSSGGAFRFKIRNLARQDCVSYANDEFGRISGYARRKFDVKGFKANVGRGGNESIFKNGLSILDDLDYIKAENQKEADAIIKVFKDNKITHLNDGRRVEDVVIRRSEVTKNL